MRKALFFIFSLSCFYIQAQIHSGKAFSIQTNILAPARIHQAANVSVLLNRENAFWEISLDVGMRLRIDNPENIKLNYYSTTMSNVPSFDITIGKRKQLKQGSSFYSGWQGSLGYFRFAHEQYHCTEINQQPNFCECTAWEDRRFYTNNIRAGVMYRLGRVIPVWKNQMIDIWAQLGIFTYFRQGFNQYKEHEHCESVRQNNTSPPIQSIMTFSLYEKYIPAYPVFQFGISYRFF